MDVKETPSPILMELCSNRDWLVAVSGDMPRQGHPWWRAHHIWSMQKTVALPRKAGHLDVWWGGPGRITGRGIVAWVQMHAGVCFVGYGHVMMTYCS